MAKPVSDDERQQIIEAFSTGKSCNTIAREFGRSSNTISRIARDVNHQFAQVNALRAREINRKYGAEWRADMRQLLADEARRLLADMRKPALVYSFGGRDNAYNEHEIEEPDFRSKRDLMQAVSTALRSIRDLDATDSTTGNLGQLGEWFAAIDRAASEYRDPAASEEAGVVDRAE